MYQTLLGFTNNNLIPTAYSDFVKGLNSIFYNLDLIFVALALVLISYNSIVLTKLNAEIGDHSDNAETDWSDWFRLVCPKSVII